MKTLIALLAGLPLLLLVGALPEYTGVDNFIDTLASVEPTTSPGGTFRLLTADDSLGLALTGTSLLLFTLEPCTILQPHIHPHPELAFPLSGNVTFSVAYNNNSFTGAVGNTRVDVGPGGYALFPTGALHVTQNEGCEAAQILAVFVAPVPQAMFFPLTEGAMPANTLASYYGGRVGKADTALPSLTTAPLAGCSCD